MGISCTSFAYESTYDRGMANVICITSGLRGLLNASFELVARLAREGHEITYASPHDVGTSVEAQGLRYVQLAAVNFNPAPPPDNTDGSLRARLEEWRSADRRRMAGIDAMNLQPFRDFVEASRPDLVLIDAELYEHIFTLYDMRVPTALITPFFTSRRAAGVPPLTLGIVPGQGARGSAVGLLLTWWQRRLQRFKQVKLVSLRNAFTERRSVLWTLARQVGYPLRDLEQYGAHTLFLDTHLPVLHLTASELEFGQTSRANVHYVGPMVAQQRVEEAVSDVDRERLNALYAKRKSDGGALLYCTPTTMGGNDARFIRRVVAAVAARPDWTLILGYSGPAGDLEVANNVHLFDYVPQIEVLAHADACITYGGMNTMHECLMQQTPMLVCPRAFDQPGVAARLVHQSLAYRADARTDSAETLSERIASLLDDQALHARWRAKAQSVRYYEERNVVAQVVNTLLT
jgi:UDP:flavonoid glycosyltransferase YjiC (YdhE family)